MARIRGGTYSAVGGRKSNMKNKGRLGASLRHGRTKGKLTTRGRRVRAR